VGVREFGLPGLVYMYIWLGGVGGMRVYIYSVEGGRRRTRYQPVGERVAGIRAWEVRTMRMLGMMNQSLDSLVLIVVWLIGTELRGGLGLYIAGCAVSPCRHV
jgi:hypothetical protein